MSTSKSQEPPCSTSCVRSGALPERFAERRKAMANSGRTRVTLACTECGDRNYTTTKNKKLHPERMEAMKYCPRLRRYTLHREVR